jgi:hypothetical protein
MTNQYLTPPVIPKEHLKEYNVEIRRATDYLIGTVIPQVSLCCLFIIIF